MRNSTWGYKYDRNGNIALDFQVSYCLFFSIHFLFFFFLGRDILFTFLGCLFIYFCFLIHFGGSFHQVLFWHSIFFGFKVIS